MNRNSHCPRWLPCILAVVFLALSPVLGHAAQTYYVGPGGNDSNPGTEAQPFRQVRKAVSLVQAGDKALVADGTYLGFDVFDKIGTAVAPITIRALGTNAVVTKTTDRGDNRDTIHISDCEHLIVDGFRSFNGNRAGLRVQGGHHVSVRNCVFGDNATWGLFTGFSEHLLVENNECYGSTNEHGIYVSNTADNPVLRGNRCWSNGGGGIQLNADINTPPGDGIITNALIEGNVLYDNGRRGGGALNLDGIQYSVVRNNLLFNNHASGIIFFQIDGGDGPRGNQVYHNTIDMAADGRWALNFLQTTGLNTVRNNILLTRHSFRGGLRFGSPADAANTDSDYNIVTRITPDDSAVLTLAEWQALGNEPHSVSGTLASVFVNVDAGNYLLAVSSPALNAAQWVVSVPTDIEGGARRWGAAADIGAYEQSPPLLGFRMLTDGRRVVRLAGGTGQTVYFDTSSALPNWSLGSSIVRSNRPIEHLDAVPAVDQRFFRARLQP